MKIFKTNWNRAALDEHLAKEHFYHSFQFTNGCEVRGDWDVAKSIEQYQFPHDLIDKRVLDVGPGSGFFSFYFESLGAKVTAIESHGYGDFDVYGQFTYTGNESRPADRVHDGKSIWYGPVSGGFWKIFEAIDSMVEWRNGKIYDVCPALTGAPFDLVFVGSLLLHLRDPIGALRAVRSVCGDLLVTTIPTWIEQDENATPMQMLPYTHIDRVSWWMPNKAALRHWLLAAGFRQVDFVGSLTIEPDKEIINAEGIRMNNKITEQIVHARI
jgi:SAM-dependent methyltransferase